MSEKYIDLAPKIAEDTEVEPIFLAGRYQREVLAWLDEHPDQVPGRTITESEMEASVVHARQCASFTTNPVGFVRPALDILGITVVPDPEPTNAEKIATEIDTYMQDHGWGDNPTAVDLAGWLSDRGVKAPGGDDER